MRPKTEALIRRNVAEQYEQIETYPEVRSTRVERKENEAKIYSTHLSGEYARSLRRLSLIQTRHEIRQFGFKFDIEKKYVDIADEIRLNAIYKKTFGDDPYSIYDAKTIMSIIGTPQQIKLNREPLILEYARTIGTRANGKILRQIKDQQLKTTLFQIKKDIRSALKKINKCLLYTNRSPDSGTKHADAVYTIANILKFYGNNSIKPKKENSLPIDSVNDDRWAKLRPNFPKLERSHNGNMNRKRRPTQTGKTPKYLTRLLTDRDKRIFARKSKSLGGTVVIDISGSMNLEIDELEKLMTSASGSTVWTYSATCDEIESENMWLVADHGRRVREIPQGNGGNGVDLPALAYAYNRKKNKKDLMIWISDGQVTGKRDYSSTGLKRATATFVRAKKIHHVETVAEAIKLMTNAQRGKIPNRKITNWEKRSLTKTN